MIPRHEHETFTDFILRWLGYWERQEPESEWERRTRG